MTTRNSRLIPSTFDPPQLKHGVRIIPEPRGPKRRPKSGDFKLLAAYVAAYVEQLIPQKEYKQFVSKDGERAWKRTLRMACDLEWVPRDGRDFDEIKSPQYIIMRDHVARAWPFAARYFDGAWLIKWALRTTWGNRKKASARADKFYEKQQRALAGQLPLSENETPTSSQLNRRPRASRLGESLYCIGGCHRMLSLDSFPDDHVGVCKACVPEQPRQRQSTIHNSNPVQARVASDDDDQQYQLPCGSNQKANESSRSLQQRTQGSTVPKRRQDRHAPLPSSVTAYSDAGEYPSGRSTYGVSKLTRRKLNKAHAPWTSNMQRSTTLRAEGVVATHISELEGLLDVLTSEEISDLRQRKADHAAVQHINTTASRSPQVEGNTSLEYGIPGHLTPSMRRCLSLICEAWGINDVKDIFPVRIWPKPGTLWNLPVLELFLLISRQYPSSHHRDEISGKFTQLTVKRRARQNAKTQWTMQDAKETQAWTKSKYGSPPPEHQHQEPDINGDENCAPEVRSSQRPRIPSRKAAALLPIQPRAQSSLIMDIGDRSDHAEEYEQSYGKVPCYGIQISSDSSDEDSGGYES